MRFWPNIKKKASVPKKNASVINQARLSYEIRAMFNPVKNMTPDKLVRQHQQADTGFISSFARTLDKIRQNDDLIPNVANKRERAPATRGYEVIALDDSEEARQHKEALEYFYDRLTVTSAIDEDMYGEAGLLLSQQMQAVTYEHTVHEVVWQLNNDGLTAELRHTPLWFFERTKGRMRFLAETGSTYGVDMEPGDWLITTCPNPIGRAISIAWLYKHTPLKDWLIYCGRHGMPGIKGKTSAQYGSEEWQAMEDAVEDFSSEFAAVMSDTDDIETIDLTANGELPYPKIVERMDRMIASLYRGADLSTISAGDGEGTGASLQGEEADIIESADCDMLAGALRRQIDRVVIRHRFGSETPLAYISINKSTKENVEQDLKVDQQLHEMGFPISIEDLAARYGRTIPDKDETLLPTSKASAANPDADPDATAANESPGQRSARQKADRVAEQLRQSANEAYATAMSEDFRPLAEALQGVLEMDEPQMMYAALRELRKELPNMLHQVNQNPAQARALEESLTAALINGYVEGEVTRQEEDAAL